MNVLFVCNYNSARSQMAAAFFNHYATDGSQADSAGITPGMLSIKAVKVMAEKGIDIFGAPVKSVEDAEKSAEPFSHLIIIGDESLRSASPFFATFEEVSVWEMADPSTFEGSDEELEELLRSLRDDIEANVKNMLL